MTAPPRSTGLVVGVVPVAVTSRSGFEESVHHGAAVALDPDGAVAFAAGEPELVIYPRSANKPLQADAMLRLGTSLTPEQLALACASHDGRPEHLAVVRSTLASVAVEEEALDTTPDLPFDRATADAAVAAGAKPAPIFMNCSGKHAAMLAACRVNGWPLERYLEADHPLQVAIGARIAELAGPVDHVGVDGCGAPAHAVSLAGLARAFSALARDRGEVWRAMTAHPDLVAGPTRDATRLMLAVPGLMAKDGAEGVFAAAVPDGRAAAVKIGDGGARAAGVVLAAALRGVGIDVPEDAAGGPILGHGRPVGDVRAILAT